MMVSSSSMACRTLKFNVRVRDVTSHFSKNPEEGRFLKDQDEKYENIIKICLKNSFVDAGGGGSTRFLNGSAS
jgi:hypothetical protein